jgi:heme/copper-type cytochrome/quinol oxidase subunit 2
MFIFVFVIIFILLFLLVVAVIYSEIEVIKQFEFASKVDSMPTFEIALNTIPVVIVIWILLPVIALLYDVNAPAANPQLTLRVTGHQ